jgi:hypothetical protein
MLPPADSTVFAMNGLDGGPGDDLGTVFFSTTLLASATRIAGGAVTGTVDELATGLGCDAATREASLWVTILRFVGASSSSSSSLSSGSWGRGCRETCLIQRSRHDWKVCRGYYHDISASDLAH